MAIKFQCPHCKIVIKSSNPIREGKKVRCPECEHIFPYSSTGGMAVPARRRTGIHLDGPQRAQANIDEATRSTRLDTDETPPRRKTKVEDAGPVADPRPTRRRPRQDNEDKTPPRRRPAREEDTDEDLPAPRSRKETRTPARIDEPRRRREREAEEDDDDLPRKKAVAKKKRSSGKLWLFLGIGGGAAVLLAIALVCVLLFAAVFSASNANVTRENFKRIAAAMPKAEVEKILGPGAPASEDDLKSALGGTNDNQQFANQYQGVARQANAGSWEQWRNGSTWIFVAFAKTRDGNDRVGLSLWVVNDGSGLEIETGALSFGDLDAVVSQNEKQQRLINDKKWRRGSQVRKLLIGAWEHLSGRYEFKNDGAVKFDGLAMPYEGRYAFTDDEHIAIDVPPRQQGPISIDGRRQEFRVLVNLNELYLVENEHTQPIPFGPYRRK